MSILNWQVNSSSNLVSFFIVMTQNFPVNFKLIHFLPWIKGSLSKSQFLDFQTCSGENLLNSSWHFWKHKSVFLQMLQSIFSVIKHNSHILFLAQALYTLFKRSPLKYKFLRFLSARVKLRQIPLVNFELTSQILFKFCIILHCHGSKLPCKF